MFDYIKRNPLIFLLIFLAIVAPQFLVGTLRFALYIILGIIILFFILGLVFRVRLQRLHRQMSDEMNRGGSRGAGQSGSYRYTWSSRSSAQQQRADADSKVKIVVDEKNHEKRVSKNIGEYVDFEEVDE